MFERLISLSHRRRLFLLMMKKLNGGPKLPSYLIDENRNYIVIGGDRILIRKYKGA